MRKHKHHWGVLIGKTSEVRKDRPEAGNSTEPEIQAIDRYTA